jgi:hypothetical protein
MNFMHMLDKPPFELLIYEGQAWQRGKKDKDRGASGTVLSFL